MKTYTLALYATALIAACTSPSEPNAETPNEVSSQFTALNDHQHLPAPIAQTYTAHAKQLPTGKDLSYQLTLSFRGSERFRGEIRHDPATSRINMTRAADQVTLRYDGTDVAVLPDTATWKGARFAVFTWPYFAAAPYKLADPGTQWSAMTDYAWEDGLKRPGSKLTFAAGTGDAPDDYYVAFRNDEGLLDGLAYIVTYGKGAEAQASAEPHAIRYSDYRLVEGVPVAHRWDFYMWDEDAGLGEALGFADLSEVAWISRDESAYATQNGSLVEAP